MLRRAIAAPVLMLLGVGALSGVATGHDDECLAKLRDAPIETVAAPPGWAWSAVAWFDIGLVTGSLDDESDDTYGYGTLNIQCSEDAAASMARNAALREAIGTTTTVTVVPIGDETQAFRDDDRPQIMWRKGDFVATLNIDAGADYGAFEEFAAAINDVLP